jgi:hypothetical protein
MNIEEIKTIEEANLLEELQHVKKTITRINTQSKINDCLETETWMPTHTEPENYSPYRDTNPAETGN